MGIGEKFVNVLHSLKVDGFVPVEDIFRWTKVRDPETGELVGLVMGRFDSKSRRILISYGFFHGLHDREKSHSVSVEVEPGYRVSLMYAVPYIRISRFMEKWVVEDKSISGNKNVLSIPIDYLEYRKDKDDAYCRMQEEHVLDEISSILPVSRKEEGREAVLLLLNQIFRIVRRLEGYSKEDRPMASFLFAHPQVEGV